MRGPACFSLPEECDTSGWSQRLGAVTLHYLIRLGLVASPHLAGLKGYPEIKRLELSSFLDILTVFELWLWIRFIGI